MTLEPGRTTAAIEPWIEVHSSPNFAAWLAKQQIGLAFTTGTSGKLFLLGMKPDRQLSVFERTFNRCVGLWAIGDQTFWLASRYQLWRFENALRPGEMHQDFDRLYVPRVGYTTSDLDAHDIVVEEGGRVVFVNTTFNCLSTVAERDSFAPLWRPPFVSERPGEDRFFLNGVALHEGKVRYATAVNPMDMVKGQRDHPRAGGVVLEVTTNQVIADGLSMPHSPRMYRGRLWLLNSGTGQFGSLDPATGKFDPLAFCPGYPRGLAFVGDFAIMGLSLRRYEKTSAGEALDAKAAEARCGLHVIDLRSGDCVEWLRLEGQVTELCDVAVLAGATRPMALGFKTDEIERLLSVGPS